MNSINDKKYTLAEKAKIALEAIKNDQTLAQITAKYGVYATQIKIWKKQALAYMPDAFSHKSREVTTTYETQLAELYEQIGQLKVENDFFSE